MACLADLVDEAVEREAEHLRDGGDGEQRGGWYRSSLDLADGLLGDACG
jgi:hypothetical protein